MPLALPASAFNYYISLLSRPCSALCDAIFQLSVCVSRFSALTFSTHSGKNCGARFDQPGAVATASLIDSSNVLRRFGCKCGIAAAAQNAAGNHGRASAAISRSYKNRYAEKLSIRPCPRSKAETDIKGARNGSASRIRLESGINARISGSRL
jgi:hypothetical protein